MTEGSFPPPPGFQPPAQPVPPGGYVGPPPAGGSSAPSPGSLPPPKKSRTGCWVGCGGGCLLLIILMIVAIFAIGPITSWLGASALSWVTSGDVVWHAASPDGAREAQLRRFGIGRAQLAYSVTIETPAGGSRCTAAFMVGPQAENYVQVQWLGPTALSIRYGSPTGPGAAFQAPTVNTGSSGCGGITVTTLHDSSLDAAAEAANNGNGGALPIPNGGGDAGGKPGGDTPAPAPAPAPDQGGGDQGSGDQGGGDQGSGTGGGK